MVGAGGGFLCGAVGPGYLYLMGCEFLVRCGGWLLPYPPIVPLPPVAREAWGDLMSAGIVLESFKGSGIFREARKPLRFSNRRRYD